MCLITACIFDSFCWIAEFLYLVGFYSRFVFAGLFSHVGGFSFVVSFGGFGRAFCLVV